MTHQEIITLAKKYITAANELDKSGFVKEAAEIDDEIFLAIEAGILPIKIKTMKIASNTKNTRVAIVGQSDWNDYLENISTGVGGGAGYAIGSGVGIPFAGIGALVGGGLGAAGTFGRDLMFNNLQGQTSKLESLNNGLKTSINALVQTVSQFNAGSAHQIMSLYEGLDNNIKSVRDQKRREISENVGLDPDKGFLQSLNPMNWGKVLNRKKQMITSSNGSKMTKKSADMTDIGGYYADPGYNAAKIMQPFQKPIADPLNPLKTIKPKLTGFTGMVGGTVGAAVGRGGYNWIANKMRGQGGIIRKQISDIQKYGIAISQALQDPAAMQTTNMIANLAQRTLQAIQSGQQPMPQDQGFMQQQTSPAQYSQSNQAFR